MSAKDLLKSPEQEEAGKDEQSERKESVDRPDGNESEENSDREESIETIIPVVQEERGSEISKSITILGKSVTHRGTQTVIHCKTDETKHDFIEMIINTKI